MTTFTSEEQQRYLRHFLLPDVGTEGQARFKSARVLCVGAGGLGSPALLYLSAAGIGTIGIVDDDVVELSNLQRQILYGVSDVGQPKVLAAESKLLAQNPNIHIHTYQQRLTPNNALEIFKDYDVILDGTDNFATRYLVNDACWTLGKPNVYAGVFQFSGECSVFVSGEGPCYRCLYPSPPSADLAPNCAQAGVLGVLPGIMGTIQAAEAIKLALGRSASLSGKVLRLDALTLAFEEFILHPDPECLLCAQNKAFHELPRYTEESCNMIQSASEEIEGITPQELKTLMDGNSDFTLLDVREPHEFELCNLGGTLIPLGELSYRHEELDADKLTIIHCRTDSRSQQAAEFLCDAGFSAVKYLKGGIIAWSRDIDSTIQQY